MKTTIDKKYLYAGLTFITTILVTFSITFYAYQLQNNYSERWFTGMAQRQTEILKEFVDNDLDQIGAGANFFYSVDPSEWPKFPTFAQQLVRSSNTLITMQWMQRVEKRDIDQFVADVRQQYPDYQIYTIPKDKPRVDGYVLENNEPIFVARYVYPITAQTRHTLGFYDARLRFQLVLDNIRVHQQVSVSDKVRLLQDSLEKTGKKDGILVYHPVFDSENNQELLGVVIGVIRTSYYFENLVKRTVSSNQLEVQVRDLGFDAEDDPVLFESANWKDSYGFSVQTIIDLPNRQWAVEFRSNKNITANDEFILAAIASGGVVIAILLSYIVFLQIRAHSHLADLLKIRTEEISFLVEHDSLTSIYNRRAFNQFISQAIIDDKKFSLIGFDIDEFKQVNDSFGHLGGDQMLCHVANTVKNCLVGDDIVARLGGDEFCIITAITDREQLEGYLEVIRLAMMQNTICLNGESATCSISIGAAIRDQEDAEQIMQLADAQLYMSKNAGRNRVSIA